MLKIGSQIARNHECRQNFSNRRRWGIGRASVPSGAGGIFAYKLTFKPFKTDLSQNINIIYF
jgi:hypothetical protein